MSGQTAERRIAANILLEETEQGFRLTFTAEDGTRRSQEFTLEHQLAKTDQTASIKEVLGKLGNTPYLCKEVEVRFSQPWFIPRSTLAEWRRRTTEHSPAVLADLQSARNEYKHLKCDKGDCGIANPYIPNGRIANPSEQEETEGASPLMTCRFCLRHAWGQCLKDRKSSNSKWREPLYLVLGDGRRFRLEFDCKKCEMYVLK